MSYDEEYLLDVAIREEIERHDLQTHPWILQTWFVYSQIRERGFNRSFRTEAEARAWIANNFCGDYTLTEVLMP